MPEEKKPLKQIVAENLTALRKSKGLTQLELAEKFNYSDKAVSKWEKGDTTPDIETLQALADFYGVTIDYFTHEGSKKEKEIYVTEKPKRNRPLVCFYYSLIAPIVAILVYVLVLFFGHQNLWPIWIWMLAADSILLFVLSCVFFSRQVKSIFGSLMTWLIVSAIYLQLGYSLPLPQGYLLWEVFLLPIPITVAFLIYGYTGKKKEEETKAETSKEA
ncbi:MAG: helix-turn-helix transcriptional regulator [Eubacteriales bacterium]|nr:helix-turn-helix transcriptional regulator [Eubacteriales bacterium]